MPNAPEKNDKHDSFQVPPEKGRADREQKERRQNKAPFEPIEQSAIAIGADHPWQVMAHCTERRDEEINVLWAPARLSQRKNRQQ
ncbi:MAG: hypothetical protein DME69_11710 [Verrucomicrobia bacterium]|nr:MAG: hypothetical protein DME69_11710 [Verrucomicrobiota bacterium]